MIKKIEDINVRFTQVIAEYMAKGMTVNTQTMSGSQGEKAKIDLTDGKHIYRIMVADGIEYESRRLIGYDTREITVEKFEITESVNAFGTLWNGRGQLVSKEVFYKLNRREIFVDSIEEIREIERKHYARQRESSNKKFVPVIKQDDKELLKNICRQHKGYGKVSVNKIAGIEKEIYRNGVVYKVVFIDGFGKANLLVKRVVKEA